MNNERVVVLPNAAIAMIPDQEMIHTFRNPGIGMLVGADWDRQELIKLIKNSKVELSGPEAASMKHGLVLKDEYGYLFIETKDSTNVINENCRKRA
jgi:hypothetical protein